MSSKSVREALREYRRTRLPNSFEPKADWSSRRRYLVTAGFRPRFRQAALRLKEQAGATGWFSDVFCVTDESPERWIQEFLSNTLEFRQRYPATFGLWYWKPFIVMKSLSWIEEDSHIYYVDAGCELSAFGEGRFKAIDFHVHVNDCIFFSTPFLEGSWTKPELIARFGGDVIASTPQVQATWFGLSNVRRMRDLVATWWHECMEADFRNLKPAEENAGNASIRHRYDQSVLSCVVKTCVPSIPLLPWEDFYVPWLYVRNSWVLLEPVHAVRRISSVSLVGKLVKKSSLEKCEQNRQDGRAWQIRLIPCRIYHLLRDERVFFGAWCRQVVSAARRVVFQTRVTP
jgi:hypothetical protein